MSWLGLPFSRMLCHGYIGLAHIRLTSSSISTSFEMLEGYSSVTLSHTNGSWPLEQHDVYRPLDRMSLPPGCDLLTL